MQFCIEELPANVVMTVVLLLAKATPAPTYGSTGRDRSQSSSSPLSVVRQFETDGGLITGVTGSSHFSLSGFLLVLQASFLDCVPFDPFPFQQDCLTSPEVHVGRG